MEEQAPRWDLVGGEQTAALDRPWPYGEARVGPDVRLRLDHVHY
jgi:hypothetical protein